MYQSKRSFLRINMLSFLEPELILALKEFIQPAYLKTTMTLGPFDLKLQAFHHKSTQFEILSKVQYRSLDPTLCQLFPLQ
jgi:hypothetical protein